MVERRQSGVMSMIVRAVSLCACTAATVWGQHPEMSRCAGREWTPPVALARSRRLLYPVVQPSIAAAAGALYVVGNRRYIDVPSTGDDLSLPQFLGYVVRPGAPPQPLAAPTPAGDVWLPRIGAREDGSVDMLWVSRDSLAVQQGPLHFTTGEIWYAHWVRGTWSLPQRLIRVPTMFWAPTGGSAVIESSDGAHFVVAGGTRLVGDPGLVLYVHVQGDSAVVREVELVTRQFAMSVSIGVSQRHTLVIATVTKALFIVRSLDGGLTWSAPQAVASFGGMDGQTVRVVATRDGRLQLVWLQRADGGVTVLRRIESSDEGATWSRSVDTTFDDAYDPVAASDSCGVLHVFSGHLAPPVLDTIVHLVNAGDEWRTSPSPLPPGQALEKALTSDAAGALYLVWSQPHPPLPGEREPGGRATFETFYSILPAPRQ